MPPSRRTFLALVALALVLGGSASLARLYAPRSAEAMPGVSFRGPPPPASPTEAALEETLREDVRRLAALGERSARRPVALAAASRLVEARWSAAGWSVERRGYAIDGRRYDNVLASRGAATDLLLVGAHYDSAEGSPGGNDNASGVAVLLSLAERLSEAPPRRSVRLVAFVNEEPPFFGTARMGSRVYAADAARRGELPTEAIVLDSVGFFTDVDHTQRFPSPELAARAGHRGDFLAFISDASSEPLLRRALGVFRARGTAVPSEAVVLDARLEAATWSDHASFWAHGVPAILLTDTAAFRDLRYHRYTDDGSQIDYRSLARIVIALEAIVRAQG